MVANNMIEHPLAVRCMTYNQARYITDAMNGFCMQQTNFPFVCTIVDDASTDGEQEVIRQYLNDNFDLQDASIAYEKDEAYGHVTFARHKTNVNCYFAVVYLNENHYSQRKPKAPYLKEWTDNVKYIALCEGDDYWTDPLKLQKQVDFLEANEECCMTACAANWVTDGKIVKNDRISDVPRDLTTDEVILGGGGYLATCSLVYKNSKLNDIIPKWRKNANVGDYPLQIQGTLVGTLHYFPDTMCVYRYNCKESWTERFLGKDKERTLLHRKAEITWMLELDKATQRKYKHAICLHLKQYFPQIYLQKKVSIREYMHVVLAVGSVYDYKRMFKDIVKRILNYHCEM